MSDDAYEGRLDIAAQLVCVAPPPNTPLVMGTPLVLGETWTAIEQPQASECLPSLWCGKEEIAVIYEAEAMVGHQNARARLASAAPDMARVLLAVEWWGEVDGEPTCPCCDHAATEHHPECDLDLSLRKAGLR